MPFTKEEAQEWAKHLNEIEAKARELETLELVKDIREAIGRDAEAAGFYGEWIDMWAEPAKKADPDCTSKDAWKDALAKMRRRAAHMPLLPSDHAHKRSFMKELGRVGIEPEDIPMTVPELIGFAIDKIEKSVDAGKHLGGDTYGISLSCWPMPLEKELFLTKSDAQRVTVFFSDFGFNCNVEPRRNVLTPGWAVNIAW